MTSLIKDSHIEDRLLAERRERGVDRFDEVWDGVYVMAAAPNDEHQNLVGELEFILRSELQHKGLGLVRHDVNISDREANWETNYRIPDVAVFLNDSAAICHGTFWQGGPDFAVEIARRDEDPRDKLNFYAAVGVRELLILDRHPWKIELYHHNDEALSLASQCTPGQAECRSNILPFAFSLSSDAQLIVRQTADNREWTIP